MPYHNKVTMREEFAHHDAVAPHAEEAAALARADRSPATAFVSLALALASLAMLWFGRALLVPVLCVAVAAIVAALLAWRTARQRHRPGGVALAALGIGLVAVAIVGALWL